MAAVTPATGAADDPLGPGEVDDPTGALSQVHAQLWAATQHIDALEPARNSRPSTAPGIRHPGNAPAGRLARHTPERRVGQGLGASQPGHRPVASALSGHCAVDGAYRAAKRAA